MQCLACFLYGFGPALIYMMSNTESYKDLGDNNRGVQEGQYSVVFTGPIINGINQSVKFY